MNTFITKKRSEWKIITKSVIFKVNDEHELAIDQGKIALDFSAEIFDQDFVTKV